MPEFNLQFPAFRAEDLDDGKQQRRIIAYLRQMYDELKFLMMNLDEENLGAGLAGTIDGMASKADLEQTDETLKDTRETLIWTGLNEESVGAGSVWGSLAAISQAVNGRRLDDTLTISLSGSVTGATTIDALTGRGRLKINAQTPGVPAYTQTGDLTLTNCMVPIEINNLIVIGKVSVSNCRFVRMNGVIIMPASQQDFALYLDQGAMCDMSECALYNGTSLIEAHEGVILTTDNIRGIGRWYINGSRMIALMKRTRPEGTDTDGPSKLDTCLTSPEDPDNDLTPDAGT